MRIDRIELRLLRLPLVRGFQTSVGRTDTRELVLVTEADGTIRAPEGPGIGVTIVADRVERATLRKETLA
jgi:hypothetical protein